MDQFRRKNEISSSTVQFSFISIDEIKIESPAILFP
jgi:hypothetical protein